MKKEGIKPPRGGIKKTTEVRVLRGDYTTGGEKKSKRVLRLEKKGKGGGSKTSEPRKFSCAGGQSHAGTEKGEPKKAPHNSKEGEKGVGEPIGTIKKKGGVKTLLQKYQRPLQSGGVAVARGCAGGTNDKESERGTYEKTNFEVHKGGGNRGGARKGEQREAQS